MIWFRRRGPWVPVMVLAVALLLPASAGDGEGALSALRKRRHELALQLIEEKARLLREDAEAKALRERIHQLYLQLDDVLASRPVVKKLQGDIADVDKALEAAARARR